MGLTVWSPMGNIQTDRQTDIHTYTHTHIHTHTHTHTHTDRLYFIDVEDSSIRQYKAPATTTTCIQKTIIYKCIIEIIQAIHITNRVTSRIQRKQY